MNNNIVNIIEYTKYFHFSAQEIYKKLLRIGNNYSIKTLYQDEFGNIYTSKEHFDKVINQLEIYKDLIPDKQEIIDNAKPLIPFKEGSYVYFLLDKDNYLIYIGQTVSMSYRISEHIKDKKPIERIFWIETGDYDRLLVEAVSIIKYNPPLNLNIPNDFLINHILYIVYNELDN